MYGKYKLVDLAGVEPASVLSLVNASTSLFYSYLI